MVEPVLARRPPGRPENRENRTRHDLRQIRSLPVIQQWDGGGVPIADLTADDRLARVTSLLAGLPGPYGNGELFVWAEHGDPGTVPAAVFHHIQDAGLLDPWSPPAPVDVPGGPAELMTRLDSLDPDAALQSLITLATRPLAYRTHGRYDEAKATEVFTTLRRLLGHDTHWWANTDLISWNPVTRHTMDAVVVGAGGGVIVTMLVFDED